MEFDLASTSYRETPVQDALKSLHEEIQSFNHANTAENFAVVLKHTPLKRPRNIDKIAAETVKLVGLRHLLDRWSSVLDLSVSVLRHLEGKPSVLPILRPDTPVQEMQPLLDAERPSESDITSFVADMSNSVQ